MTMRLSKSSFTGTARTDVAVGSSSEAFMFFATAADGPRSVTNSGPAAGRPRRLAAAAGFGGGRLGRRGLAGASLRRGRPRRAAGVGSGGRQQRREPARRPEPGCGCGGGRGRGGAGAVACGPRGAQYPPVAGVSGRPACSRRRSPTRLGRPSSGPGGTAGRSRRRATHWVRTQRQGSCPLGPASVEMLEVTGGLWRHGGNRPLPLHKVMDSGNKGYAPRTGRVRPGPSIVA